MTDEDRKIAQALLDAKRDAAAMALAAHREDYEAVQALWSGSTRHSALLCELAGLAAGLADDYTDDGAEAWLNRRLGTMPIQVPEETE
jgi:hypothetical protein